MNHGWQSRRHSWNNGDMSRSAPLTRVRANREVLLEGPVDAAFRRTCATLSAGRVDGWRPEPRCCGGDIEAANACWTDAQLGSSLLARPDLVAHGYTAACDAERCRWQALLELGDCVAVELAAAVSAEDGRHAVVRISLVASALQESGNALLNGEAASRLKGLVGRLAQAIQTSTGEGGAPGGASCQEARIRTSQEIGFDTAAIDVGRIMALACPVAELDWIEGWFFDLRHSDSGRNEPGCVFVEALTWPLLFARRGRTWWYTTLLDPSDGCLEAVLLVGQDLLGKVEWVVEGLPAGSARLRITLTLTARTEQGRRLVAEPGLDERMTELLGMLVRAAGHYLKTGKMLRIPADRKMRGALSRLHLRLRSGLAHLRADLGQRMKSGLGT